MEIEFMSKKGKLNQTIMILVNIAPFFRILHIRKEQH